MSDSLPRDSRSAVKQALLELRRMRARIEELEQAGHDPVAIVGVGLRLPGGATDTESFWAMLLDGVDAVSEVPPERWDLEQTFSAERDAPGKLYCRHGAFLPDVDQFDAAFFGISPREAETMDPQQRLVLETGWEALENAGIAPRALKGSATGVFLGAGNSDYMRMVYERTDAIDAYATSGSTPSIAASRLSYLLDLRGPSVAIDTACSASLVAAHYAIRSLRAGECDLALAGGVNLILSPELTINFCKAGMLAADGRCKTFDAAADGYVRGEGCGLVVLKRLKDALADGDRILAVIRGSAVNQDGRTSGITAPNGPAQEAVIRAALEDAGAEAADVAYVETHGTGTALGDPIEVQALGAVYGAAREADRPLLAGSVKTNMGHLELAAGVAGLIKAALCVNKRAIPPHLHFNEFNPHIDAEKWRLKIPTKPMQWPKEEKCLAAVSSFGFSGTNAHVVLEAPPRVEIAPVEHDRPVHLLALSARDEKALDDLVERYAHFASQAQDVSLGDVCQTANAGRAHFAHRLAVPAPSMQALHEALEAVAEGRMPSNAWRGVAEEGTRLPVAFLFTGQGSQYVNMGRELYDTCAAFRESFDACAAILEGLIEQPLKPLVFDDSGHISPLHRTQFAQPALFALEYSLAQTMRSWGIEPMAVMGHSLGEYVAACLAGVFPLEVALRIVARRGEFTGSPDCSGKMAAVFAGEATVRDAIGARKDVVSISALNAPDNTVISGQAHVVDAIAGELQAAGVEVRPLAVSQAFHSPCMAGVADEFGEFLSQFRFQPPRMRLVANLSGEEAGKELAKPAYWVRHLTEPVRFQQSIEHLLASGIRCFVEIGPHPVLAGMARRFVEDEAIVWAPTLQRDGNDWTHLAECMARLYVNGAPIDWKALDRGNARRRVALPTYPFQHARHWLPQREEVRGARQSEPWQTAVSAAREQSSRGPLGFTPESYGEKWDALEELAVAAVAEWFERNRLLENNLVLDVEEVMRRAGAGPAYRHLMKRWLALLERHGLLEAADGAWRVRSTETPGRAAPLERCHVLFADAPRFMDYIERCLSLLDDVLCGRQNALETLFPAGQPEEAEWLYGEWAVSAYFNDIIRAAVHDLALSSPRPLRIMEIGAGTGGTAARVLEGLRHAAAQYWFTDMSEFFFNRARERFAAFAFVRYAIFNAEQPPEEQDIPPHAFDIVIAANTLHATRDLDQTLDHVRALLKPSGIVLLYEVTDHPAWFDISTGLIEGWQRFEDSWRAEDSPLLSAGKWSAALQAHGFETVEAFPAGDQVAQAIGHHVIAARAPADSAAEVADEKSVSRDDPGKSATHEKKSGAEPSGINLAGLKAMPPRECREQIVRHVREQAARVLRLPLEKAPGARSRLMDAGIDSLMALELRARLEAAFGLKGRLGATLVFDHPTPEAIAALIEQSIGAEGSAGDVPRAADSQSADLRAPGLSREALAGMSDEDVEAMLLSSLDESNATDER